MILRLGLVLCFILGLMACEDSSATLENRIAVTAATAMMKEAPASVPLRFMPEWNGGAERSTPMSARLTTAIAEATGLRAFADADLDSVPHLGVLVLYSISPERDERHKVIASWDHLLRNEMSWGTYYDASVECSGTCSAEVVAAGGWN